MVESSSTSPIRLGTTFSRALAPASVETAFRIPPDPNIRAHLVWNCIEAVGNLEAVWSVSPPFFLVVFFSLGQQSLWFRRGEWKGSHDDIIIPVRVSAPTQDES